MVEYVSQGMQPFWFAWVNCRVDRPVVSLTKLVCRLGEAVAIFIAAEDDVDVWDFLVSALRRLSYTVLGAGDESTALRLMAVSDGIEFLMSDVILLRCL